MKCEEQRCWLWLIDGCDILGTLLTLLTFILRTAVFCVITRRVVVIYYRRFGITCRAYLQRPVMMGPIGCTETLVRNYYYKLRSNPEMGSSNLRRGGSLKSRIILICLRMIARSIQLL